MRSQSRWYNEDEKNTKYFLNLEKRIYKQGTISQLRINIDNFINTKDSEILIECLSYFKNLYTAKLTDGQARTLHQPIFLSRSRRCTYLKSRRPMAHLKKRTECLSSLKEMVDSKTPGPDGLPAEFYKLF